MGESFGILLGREIREARESRGWTQLDLALQAFADETKERRIRDYETGNVDRPQPKIYAPICDALGISRHRRGELKALASNAREQNDADTEDLIAQIGSLEGALSDLRRLTTDQLETLATRFEIPRAYDLSNGQLVEVLTLKATDYRELKAEVEAIDDGMKRLSNLKGGVRSAIARGDLVEVETLLARVQEAELEEAARTAELRAANALLSGRVEQAFTLLSAAADSFAALDPLEPALCRLGYADFLYQHGLRYGGRGLVMAAKMGRDVVNLIKPKEQSDLWATANNALGLILQDQGGRTRGSESVQLISEAIDAFNTAISVYSGDPQSLGFSAITNNTGLAMWELGRRTTGAESDGYFLKAIDAYMEAASSSSVPKESENYAQVKNNLGLAQSDLGERTTGASGTALLLVAMLAFQEALVFRTKDAYPEKWAQTKNHLGLVFSRVGARTVGKRGDDLVERAFETIRATLNIRTQAEYPMDWAKTQKHLACVEIARAQRETCANPQDHFQAALGHVDAALEVLDPQHSAFDFDDAILLRDRILKALNP